MKVGVPTKTQRTLESSPLASASLTDPHRFGCRRVRCRHDHLTRPSPGETHQSRQIRGLHRPAMDITRDLHVGQSLGPHITEPPRRTPDVVVPESMMPRDQHIDPEREIGPDDHDPTATSTSHDVDPST